MFINIISRVDFYAHAMYQRRLSRSRFSIGSISTFESNCTSSMHISEARLPDIIIPVIGAMIILDCAMLPDGDFLLGYIAPVLNVLTQEACV